MVAIVVLLAATVSVFFFDVTEDINQPAPVVGQTSGEFEAGGDFDQQIVRITHVAGDGVNVENIEIIVRASGPGDSLPAEARLVNLPSDGFQETIDDSNIRGDELIDTSSGSFGRPPPQIIIREDSNTWSAGKTINFRIKVSGADFRDSAKGTDEEAEKLEVVIIHTPSNSILSEYTFSP
jgi:FlaG/FlaF family flagellin (archaellin)